VWPVSCAVRNYAHYTYNIHIAGARWGGGNGNGGRGWVVGERAIDWTGWRVGGKWRTEEKGGERTGSG
jgi:hypothetical protein